MLTRANLHPYQRRMIELMLRLDRVGIWAEMGLGKTVSALTAAWKLLGICEVRRVLVVAPLKVARRTWPDEIHEWEHLQELTINFAGGGSEKSRVAAIDSPSDIVTVNVENFRWLIQRYLRKWHAWPFDLVIIDEASKFKTPGARRTRSLTRHAHKFPRIIELTGYPSSKGLQDIWAQVYALDGGLRLGTAFDAYTDRFFYSDYSGYGLDILPAREEEIHRLVSDICFSLKTADYLSLPGRHDLDVFVDLPPKARRMYDEMEKSFKTTVDDEGVEAVNSGVKWGKLRQIASGVLFDNESEVHTVHSEKMDALSNIADESYGEPMAVVYQYVPDRERIKKMLGKHCVIADKNGDFVHDWNRKKIPFLLMPPGDNHGLNIQKGGHSITWFGVTPSLDDYIQTVTRFDRQGQIHPVFNRRILSRNTVDEDILANLGERNDNQLRLKNATRLRVERRFAA